MYSSPITLHSNTILKAIAVKSGMRDSGILEVSYKVIPNIAMVSIPATATPVTLGSPVGETGRDNVTEDEHPVTLGAFKMSKYEVTQALWEAVMGNNPCYFDDSYDTDLTRPVENVNWYDAIAFCNKLSVLTGLDPVYSVKINGNEVDWANLDYGGIPHGAPANSDWDKATMDKTKSGYRLPTEAEWEYACRGKTTTPWQVAESSLATVAWYGANAGNQTHPVETKLPNLWGLYNMHGNVAEWCWDWFTAYTAGAALNNPPGPSSGTNRVLRGGFWDSPVEELRSAYRYFLPPFFRGEFAGIRLVQR